MVAMTMVTRRGPLTRADLDALPDDGLRHELIDGVLVMTPAPGLPHQVMVGELYLVLRAACPPELRVILAPFDVALADDTIVEPDLLVAPRSQFSRKDLPGSPLLAVEVLSRSTRHLDRRWKFARYAEAGCPSYWIIDPEAPSITAFALDDSEYAEVAKAVADEAFEVDQPFPVTLTPAALLDV